MSISSSQYSAEEAAELGDSIYEQEIRSKVEGEHLGKVVAIDIQSHKFVVDKNALVASRRLLDQCPNADIWCVRVGHRALHHIGLEGGNVRITKHSEYV